MTKELYYFVVFDKPIVEKLVGIGFMCEDTGELALAKAKKLVPPNLYIMMPIQGQPIDNIIKPLQDVYPEKFEVKRVNINYPLTGKESFFNGLKLVSDEFVTSKKDRKALKEIIEKYGKD